MRTFTISPRPHSRRGVLEKQPVDSGMGGAGPLEVLGPSRASTIARRPAAQRRLSRASDAGAREEDAAPLFEAAGTGPTSGPTGARLRVVGSTCERGRGELELADYASLPPGIDDEFTDRNLRTIARTAPPSRDRSESRQAHLSRNAPGKVWKRRPRRTKRGEAAIRAGSSRRRPGTRRETGPGARLARSRSTRR